MSIQVQPADSGALPIIRSIAERTWPVSYGKMISPEQIVYMLEMMYSDQSLRQQITEGIRFLLGYKENEPVGFSGFGPKKGNSDVYRLEKLYVLPSHQSFGAGRRLLEEVIIESRRMGALFLELNVNRKNPSVEFYKKMGFTIRESQDINIGGGFFMNDYIMEIPLQ